MKRDFASLGVSKIHRYPKRRFKGCAFADSTIILAQQNAIKYDKNLRKISDKYFEPLRMKLIFAY